MSVNIHGILSDFDEADPTGTSDTPKLNVEGHHLVQVEALKLRPSKKDSNTYFIVEMKLQGSTCPGLSVGVTYGWVHNLNNRHFGAANTKQFIAAAMGLAADSDEAKKLKLHHLFTVLGMVDADGNPDPEGEVKPPEEQPLTGRYVWVKTIPSEGDKGKYTKHRWAPAHLNPDGQTFQEPKFP